jgi:hypothetical protein
MHRNNKITAQALLAAVLSLALIATGCSTPSLKQVSAFGTATESIASHAQTALQSVDEASIKRKLYDVAANTNQWPTDATFSGVLAGNPQSHADLQMRLKLLRQVGAYATALKSLAEADFRKDIDDASKDLHGALSGLNSTYKAVSSKELLSQDSLGIIATTVDAIGAAIVEAKRRKAIRDIVNESDAAVSNAMALVSTELGAGSSIAQYVVASLDNAKGTLQQVYNTERANPAVQFQDRLKRLEDIRQLHNAARDSATLFSQVSKASAQVAKAHAELKEAANSGKLNGENLAKAIGELVDYAKSVKEFHDSLATAK